MRLIRLQTDHDNCMFDNSFQDDILIQPGAKIALQNVCILKTPESVYIGNLDITITFKISGADDAAPPTVTLNTGSYDKNNFDALLSEITTKMNGALHIIRARHLGIQWKAHLVDNVVRIEYEQPFRTSLRSMMSKYSFATLNGVTTSGSQSLVAQGENTEPTGTQFIYVNAPITKGCGIFSAKVIDLIATAGASSTGFILGLVAKQVGAISKIEKATYLFGVATLGQDSANTPALVNGNTAATTGSTAKNDFVGIGIHTNQVHMVLYKNASPSKTVIHSADIDPSVDYYPAITFFNAARSCRPSTVRWIDRGGCANVAVSPTHLRQHRWASEERRSGSKCTMRHWSLALQQPLTTRLWTVRTQTGPPPRQPRRHPRTKPTTCTRAGCSTSC